MILDFIVRFIYGYPVGKTEPEVLAENEIWVMNAVQDGQDMASLAEHTAETSIADEQERWDILKSSRRRTEKAWAKIGISHGKEILKSVLEWKRAELSEATKNAAWYAAHCKKEAAHRNACDAKERAKQMLRGKV